jgi:hypothetical protein
VLTWQFFTVNKMLGGPCGRADTCEEEKRSSEEAVVWLQATSMVERRTVRGGRGRGERPPSLTAGTKDQEEGRLQR